MSTLLPNAIDVVQPAIYRTRRELFQPFRLGMWLRFAFLAIFTGEMSSGGGGFPNFNSAFHLPQHSTGSQRFAGQLPFSLPSLHQALPFIIAAALLFVVLYFVFLYISSVLRFVLLESVIAGDVRIGEGWRRWQAHGTSLFAWRLVFSVIVGGVNVFVIGLPVFAAWRAGLFHDPRQHLFLLVFGAVILFTFAMAVLLVTLIVWVFTKDFVVPMMAAEGIGPVEGWRRLMQMLSAAKGSYAGYIGFKAVLALAGGMVVAVISIMLIFMLVIPAVIVGVIVGIAMPGGGVAWSAATLTLIIVVGGLLFLAIFFLISMISVPLVVFFQSYSLHFFAPRYAPLYNMMFPPLPPPAAATV